MKDIILFGIQGVGKGTQAELILKKHDIFSSFATGDVFRALMSQPNAIQSYVTRQVDAGKYVADEVTIKIFEAYAATLEKDKAMLLDGYPRSIQQLESFLLYEKEQQRDCVAIIFDLSVDDAIERMMGRGRHDDTPEKIRQRLSEYDTHTQPVIDLFGKEKPTYHIDGRGTIEVIAAEVESIIQSLSVS